MNCKDARLLLDAYMDGEISDEDMQALKDHAKACECCAEELKAAELLRDTLTHMDDDVSVPLQAQAAWRKAIREEAKKKMRRNWVRGAYAVAAVLVLVLGVNLMYDGKDTQMQGIMPAAEVEEASGLIVARDGGPRIAKQASGQAADYTVWKKLSVPSEENAVRSLAMLTEEYSGACIRKGESVYSVEIPGSYLDDFLKAAASIGAELDSEIVDSAGETAVVLFQFVQE